MRAPRFVATWAILALVLVQVMCQEEESHHHDETNGQDQTETQQSSDMEVSATEAQQDQQGDQPTGTDVTAGYEHDLRAAESSTDQQSDRQEQTPGDDGSSAPVDEFVEPETDEPDKSGEELVAQCRSESNYQGDFKDPNEATRELKCFYACALVKMDIMAEEEGRLAFRIQEFELLLQDHFGDNTEIVDEYKDVATSCNEEVPAGGDKCEYVFDFISCGVRKLSSSRR